MPEICYRPFETPDFDALAEILQPLWHTRSSIERYNFLEACDDLAYCLSVSNFTQVALVDGVPGGVVLARGGSVDTAWAARWQGAARGYLEQMDALDAHSARRYQAHIDLSCRIGDDLVAACGAPAESEVTLLAVHGAARRRGIGATLLEAAAAHLAASGQARLYLSTDTECNWAFYERQGLTRLAAHRASADERELLPEETYLYGLDLAPRQQTATS